MKPTYKSNFIHEGIPSLLACVFPARSFPVRLLSLLDLSSIIDQPFQLKMSRRRNDDYELHSHTRQPW